MQKEILHQTHRFLVLFFGLYADELIVARADALELLLERLGVLQDILNFYESLLGIFEPVLSNHAVDTQIMLRVNIKMVDGCRSRSLFCSVFIGTDRYSVRPL